MYVEGIVTILNTTISTNKDLCLGAGRVNHVEDAKYTWAVGNYSDLNAADSTDVLMVERYLKLFTDFAKTM